MSTRTQIDEMALMLSKTLALMTGKDDVMIGNMFNPVTVERLNRELTNMWSRANSVVDDQLRLRATERFQAKSRLHRRDADAN